MRFEAFSCIYLLALLPLLLALYGYGFWRRRRSLAAFIERPLAGRLLPRINRTRRWLKALCLVAAAMCLVVALMQPQWGETPEDVPRRGRDLVVMLDTSLSMLAEDVAPNRLEYAKSMVREPRPQRGDLIVAHDLSMLESDRLPAARFLRRITDETPGGRLMSKEAGAGFYSNGWGYLPWTFSTLPLDRYDLYEVE